MAKRNSSPAGDLPAAPIPLAWKNRIVGYGEEAPDQLLRNPRNHRVHPGDQMDALRALLRNVGVVQNVIVNKRTGFMVDGHARVTLAMQDGVPNLPITYIDLSDDEEAQIVALLDHTGALAQIDEKALAALLNDIHDAAPAVQEQLAAMYEHYDLGDLAAASEGPDDIEDVSSELEGAQALKQDMQFKDGIPPWDIPPFRTDMLATIPEGLKTWAGPDATKDEGEGYWLYNWGSDSMRGLPADRRMLGFYVDDYRFEKFFNEPDVYTAKALNAGFRTSITPNFSLWCGQSRAIHLFNTFRARWIGRYFQEAGIKIIPDVNWADPQSFDYCLLGIPKNAPAIAVQLQTLRGEEEIARAVNGLNTVILRLEPQSLLVYGGPAAEPVIEKAGVNCPVTLLENRVALRRSIMDRRKK